MNNLFEHHECNYTYWRYSRKQQQNVVKCAGIVIISYHQTNIYHENYPLHLTLLQDTGNQSFVKSSHSIVQREETSHKEKMPIKLVTVSQE